MSDSDDAHATNERWKPRTEIARFLELLAATTFAFAQPALDLLAKNPVVFSIRRARGLETVVFALLVVFAPPVLAYLLELLTSLLGAAVRRVVHATLLGCFLAIAVEEFAKSTTSLHVGALTWIGAIGGLVGAALALFVRPFLTILRYASPIAIFVLVSFLAFSPITDVVFGNGDVAAAGATVGRPKRVVFVVMDEFPTESLLDGSGHVDAGLFPNFAELADTSTWYRNTTTVHPFTEWAVPALLTGRYPTKPKATPLASEYPDSLFRLLGGVYKMNVHEPITRLCPDNVCGVKANNEDQVERVTKLLTATTRLWKEFARPQRTVAAPFEPPLEINGQLPYGEQFVPTLRPSKRPVLDYLHVLLPHEPWHYLPSGQDSGHDPNDPFLKENLVTWHTDGTARVGRERHLLQLQAADRLLGQILRRLREIGALDDSILVVTADHGVAFQGGQPMRAAVPSTADQILYMPLFVKDARQSKAVVDDRPMQTIDILPTLASMLRVKIPWHVDGVTATGPARTEFARRLYQWILPPLMPKNQLVARDGEYLTFDATTMFPKVLSSRAAPVAPPGVAEALRPYIVGKYGGLIGAEANPMVRPDAPGASSIGLNQAVVKSVDPTSWYAPWTWLQGYANGVDADQEIAIAVNGRIAGLGSIQRFKTRNAGFYSVAVAPSFFVSGRNQLDAYTVTGLPSAPVLKHIPG